MNLGRKEVGRGERRNRQDNKTKLEIVHELTCETKKKRRRKRKRTTKNKEEIEVQLIADAIEKTVGKRRRKKTGKAELHIGAEEIIVFQLVRKKPKRKGERKRKPSTSQTKKDEILVIASVKPEEEE